MKYKKIANILRWIIAVICLAYIVNFFCKNTEELKKLSLFQPIILVYIILLQLIYHTLNGMKFKIVLEKCSNKKVKFLPWMKIFILGRFLNTVIPQSGNIYRGITLKKQFDVSYTRYISGYSSFAWMEIFVNLFIAALAIFLINPGFRIGSLSAWKTLIFLSLISLAFPILIELIFNKITFKNQNLNWLHSKLAEVITVSVSNLKDPVYMLKIVLFTIIIFARTCLAFYLYFKVFNLDVSLPALLVFCSLFKISAFIIITPSNIGIQELAYGFLCEKMEIGAAQGILVSALIRVVSVSVIIILGIALGGKDLIRRRKDYQPPQKQKTNGD